MPRDGSGVYQRPPGTDGVPDTSIESTKYNSNVADVETDLNAPRPIVAGGTGATSADGALVNVSGEKATQLVTNYNSHLFFPGSFRSANTPGIPGAPIDSHAFAGIAYLNEPLVNPPTNQNLIIEARDESDTNVPGFKWIREKKAGVWSAWSQSAESVAVRYDFAQSLTDVQQTQARTNIYAAPFDAMAYSGMQVNGSMEVSQERGGAFFSNAAGYVCDGWRIIFAGGMGFDAKADNTGGTLFYTPYRLIVFTSVAQPSLGAADFLSIHQRIEGWRILRLGWGTANAKPITIGFWSAHFRTGIYSVSVRNKANNRSYATTYTHNVSNGAQYNVVTIPGDTSGTWDIDNTLGIELNFAIAAGTGLIASSANTWGAGAFIAAPGQVNAVGATSDIFRITGVVVIPGTQAPPAAQSPLIMRPFDQELMTCQRYYEKTYLYGDAPGKNYAANNTPGDIEFTVPFLSNYPYISFRFSAKRAAPSVVLYSPFTGISGAMRDVNSSVDRGAFTQSIGMSGATALINNTSIAAGVNLQFHAVMDARL